MTYNYVTCIVAQTENISEKQLVFKGIISDESRSIKVATVEEHLYKMLLAQHFLSNFGVFLLL